MACEAGAQEWKPRLPDELNWIKLAAYPGVKFAVLSGGFGKPGPFTIQA